MAIDNKGFVCHKHTTMVPVHVHHVWPRKYHGPDTDENLVRVCPNGHYMIHDLLDKMLAGKSYDIMVYGPSVRKIAQSGYEQVMEYLETLVLDRQ